MTDLYGKLKAFHATLEQSQSSLKPSRATDLSNPASSSPQPDSLDDSASNVNRESSPILAKLRSMPGIVLGKDLVSHIQQRTEDRESFLAKLGGEVIENSQGAYWQRERHYRYSELHADPRQITGIRLAQLGGSDLENLAPQDLIYLDTETTGLSGGMGTIPFLAGVGWCEKKHFCVRQFLARDYDDEAALLHSLAELLKTFPALVTYNGKGYDAPLLQNRFILHRQPVSFENWLHLDLLYAARRIWKARFQNCSLGNLEKEVLGIPERLEDIPGEQIPYVYFDFIRGRRIDRMKPVLEHNAQDIVSLAMLTSRAGQILEEPKSAHALECWSIARWQFAEQNHKNAADLFTNALENDLPLDARFHALRMLAVAQRRLNGYRAASEVWEKLLAPEFPPHPLPCIELAKFYEHTEKEYQKAFDHVERALEALLSHRTLWAGRIDGTDDEVDFPDSIHLTEAAARNIREDIEKRKARLLQKIEKQKSQ